MARKTINNIEKAMSAGGRDEAPRLNIKQFIKMAEKDPEVLRFDAESEINQLMREKYLKERKLPA
jgi:hypothetical protein